MYIKTGDKDTLIICFTENFFWVPFKGYFYGMEVWFKKRLIRWYQGNARDLPWRQTRNPYFIWLSEIILQQTQVQQGLPYYLRFVKAYPTVQDLAKAPTDDVLKLWQGLGYYSRARNLQFAANTVVRELGGTFPSSFKALKQLKGVGDYTAAAIASIAFNEPVAAVDGNVYRVLSRIFAIDTPIDSPKGKSQFAALAQALLDQNDPGTFNQALMEFGALYCKPVQPNCGACVFADKCLAYQAGRVAELPIKAKKTKIKALYFNYLVMIDPHQKTLLKKRTSGAIWEGLYEFILHADETPLSVVDSLRWLEKNYAFAKKATIRHESKSYKHLLSHRTIHARFIVLGLTKDIPGAHAPIPLKAIADLPVARLTEKFLEDYPL